MDKKISVAEYIKRSKEFNESKGIVVRDIEIEQELEKARKKSKSMIKEELQDYFSLLDLGITVMTEIHNVCKEKNFLYACVSAKLVTQLLSMRLLLLQGYMDSVKPIYRSFHEMMEIFFACLIDKEFAEKYGKIDELYDNHDFWKENINGNKLDKYVHKLFDALDYPKEAKKEYFKRRKQSAEFLSQSVHAMLNSAFSNYLMTTMDAELSSNVYGKITTAYPLMMYEILYDINMLNAIFFRVIDEEKSFSFKPEDVTGTKWLRYHYYVQLYDTVYDLYYQELYKKAYDINDALKEAYKIVKEMETTE